MSNLTSDSGGVKPQSDCPENWWSIADETAEPAKPPKLPLERLAERWGFQVSPTGIEGPQRASQGASRGSHAHTAPEAERIADRGGSPPHRTGGAPLETRTAPERTRSPIPSPAPASDPPTAVGGEGSPTAAPLRLDNGVKIGPPSDFKGEPGFALWLERFTDSRESAPRIASEVRSQMLTLPLSKRGGWEDRASRLARCGTSLVIRSYLDAGAAKIKGGNFCQSHLACRGCAAARSVRRVGAMAEKAEALLIAHNALPHLITLTQPAGGDLPERIRSFTAALRRLGQRYRDVQKGKRSRDASSISPALGVVWCLEVKRGSGSGLWHVHAHGLAITPRGRKYDLDQLHQEWSELSGGAHRPDVKLMHSGRLMLSENLDAGTLEERYPGRLIGDLCEVFKYVTKLGELTPADTAAVWLAMFRKHAQFSWGCFRGLKLPNSPIDPTEDAGRWLDRFLRWASGAYVLDASRRGVSDAVPF